MSAKELDRATMRFIKADAFRTSIHQKHGLLYFRAVRDAIKAGDVEV